MFRRSSAILNRIPSKTLNKNRFILKTFSTLPQEDKTAVDQVKIETKPLDPIKTLVYEGMYIGQLRKIKRFSITTTIMGLLGLPTAIYLYKGGMSEVGQFLISGTVLFTTGFSTVILQGFTFPYVTKIYKVEDPLPTDCTPEAHNPNTRYLATRLNIFGNEKETEFKADQMERISITTHPLGSFKANTRIYYVLRNLILDEDFKKLVKEE